MEIKGKIFLIGKTESFANDFTKRDVVIETTEEQYPQKLKVEFIKDKCSVLDNYKVGDEVAVGINLRGNEYQGKFYVSIQGWKINKTNSQNTSSASTSQNQNSSQMSSDQNEISDDLPF